jgi:hypothetical protein
LIITSRYHSADLAGLRVRALLETDGETAVDVELAVPELAPGGEIAVCTAHGDVWLVDGIDESLDRLEWRRFATGLNMPFGVRVVDGRIYVSNEDELTGLHDRSGNGGGVREGVCRAGYAVPLTSSLAALSPCSLGGSVSSEFPGERAYSG